MRLVWGLGTRAVDRVGNDYPRLVALSHPLLHPEASAKGHPPLFPAVCRPDRPGRERVQDPAGPRGAATRATRRCATWPRSTRTATWRRCAACSWKASTDQLVLTFDELLRRTPLADRMRKMLQAPGEALPLAGGYGVHRPDRRPGSARSPRSKSRLLQCRPQSHLKESEARLPQNFTREDIIFSTQRMAPQGTGERHPLRGFRPTGGLFRPAHPGSARPSWAGPSAG